MELLGIIALIGIGFLYLKVVFGFSPVNVIKTFFGASIVIGGFSLWIGFVIGAVFLQLYIIYLLLSLVF